MGAELSTDYDERTVIAKARVSMARAEVTRALRDGETIELRDRRLEVQLRPGHSPSDTLFWDAERRILFGADHLLEGSVRRAGDKLRITAQLIDAKDGFHLWSESYDRVLEDIFAGEGFDVVTDGLMRAGLGCVDGGQMVSIRPTPIMTSAWMRGARCCTSM